MNTQQILEQRAHTARWIRQRFQYSRPLRRVSCNVCKTTIAAGDLAGRVPSSVYNNTIQSVYVCQECFEWILDDIRTHLPEREET